MGDASKLPEFGTNGINPIELSDVGRRQAVLVIWMEGGRDGEQEGMQRRGDLGFESKCYVLKKKSSQMLYKMICRCCVKKKKQTNKSENNQRLGTDSNTGSECKRHDRWTKQSLLSKLHCSKL